jgi:hypothetical protein
VVEAWHLLARVIANASMNQAENGADVSLKDFHVQPRAGSTTARNEPCRLTQLRQDAETVIATRRRSL